MLSTAPKCFHSLRCETRFPTDFRAIVRWDETFAFVRIADIADNGLRLIGRQLPDIGALVRIGAKGLNERGRVVWRTTHGCGVMMRQRIDALRVVRANCFPAHIQSDHEQPLDLIQRDALAEVLADVFQDKPRARSFLGNRPTG